MFLKHQVERRYIKYGKLSFMGYVESITENGHKYRFKPPIDVGSYQPDTLGELVAIAGFGPLQKSFIIAGLTRLIYNELEADVKPEDAVPFIEEYLKGKHTVEVSRCDA